MFVWRYSMYYICEGFNLVLGMEGVVIWWRPEFTLQGKEKIPYGHNLE